VVARSVETALHKLHELDFDLKTIIDSTGTAPIPPIANDDMTALGWTNDSMLYGAKVELTVDTTDHAIETIADEIPSCSSSEFGTPFLEIFNKYDKDFYKIDKMLFSPAEVIITNSATGRVFHLGKVRNDILKESFGI
jgi:methenyltetrahydromethanopterin cyclohydrolase